MAITILFRYSIFIVLLIILFFQITYFYYLEIYVSCTENLQCCSFQLLYNDIICQSNIIFIDSLNISTQFLYSKRGTVVKYSIDISEIGIGKYWKIASIYKRLRNLAFCRLIK